jgi:hypothetical protein
MYTGSYQKCRYIYRQLAKNTGNVSRHFAESANDYQMFYSLIFEEFSGRRNEG